jgi:hypothetical protein
VESIRAGYEDMISTGYEDIEVMKITDNEMLTQVADVIMHKQNITHMILQYEPKVQKQCTCDVIMYCSIAKNHRPSPHYLDIVNAVHRQRFSRIK